MSFWDKEETLGEVKVNESNKIVISKCEKNGGNFIALREFYLDKEDNFKPGKKGISLKEDIFRDVVNILERSW